MWLFSCQGFRAHVAVMLFPSMVHGATWLQSDHSFQMHFLPAATLSTPERSPSPTVCLSASSHEEASCHPEEAGVAQADEDQVRPLLLWDIMVQCQNPQKPCGSWVMHKVANRPTCQLCNFPWRKSHSKWVGPSSMRIGWSSSCRRPLQLPSPSLQP